MTKILTEEDVVELLRHQVNKTGDQNDWAKTTGVHRNTINKALQRRITPTQSIIDALNLKIVYRLKKKASTKRPAAKSS
jgi:DNA-binding phage protein